MKLRVGYYKLEHDDLKIMSVVFQQEVNFQMF